MRRLAAVLALFAALAVAVPRAAQALAVPSHGGQWVADLAGLLPPADKNALGAELRRYAEASGNQIVVLTVPSLEGENIAAYANRVARQWGVGAKNANTGVLILVAKAEARVRFEVGRGLEDRLTDALSKRIQREVTVPHFRAGRFGQGLAETVAAIEAALGPGAVGRGGAAPAAGQPAAAPARKHDSGFPWLTLGLVVLATVLAIAVLSRRRGPSSGYGRGYGPGLGAPYGGDADVGGRGASFVLGMLLGMFSSRWRGPGGGGGFGGGGDGGFGGGGGDFGGGGGDSGFGGGDDNS